MKKASKYFVLLIMASVLFTSCNKEDEDEDTTPDPTPAAAPSNPIPAPAGANGALVAIQTANYISTPLGTIYQPLGIGVAVYGDLSASTFQDAGAITLNTNALTKQTNNSYVYTPSATNTTGIEFDSGINWTVAGNSGSGAPQFSHSAAKQMPTGPNYTGSTTIARNSEFTLSSSVSIANADSVIYQLISPSGNVLKTVPGGTNSVTFTAAEMGGLGAGQGYLQIVPYNIEPATYGGKTFYFINEAVLTKSVTFN